MHSAKCYHSLLDVSGPPLLCLSAHLPQLTLLMLHHCDTPQHMNSLLATLERYSLLWTCMDILPTIVAALDSAHQAWKVHGTQSRSLLLLLLKFDNNRYLSPTSRDQIMSDVASFELVSDKIHADGYNLTHFVSRPYDHLLTMSSLFLPSTPSFCGQSTLPMKTRPRNLSKACGSSTAPGQSGAGESGKELWSCSITYPRCSLTSQNDKHTLRGWRPYCGIPINTSRMVWMKTCDIGSLGLEDRSSGTWTTDDGIYSSL